MSTQTSHREFIKAIVTGDTGRANDLNSSIPQVERKDFHVLVSAFFSVMLERQFKEDSSREAIHNFVEQMRYDFRNAEPPIKPLVIEGLIRASCGEEQFFDELEPADTFRAEFQVITKVAHEHADVAARIDDYLADAELLASEWASEQD